MVFGNNTTFPLKLKGKVVTRRIELQTKENVGVMNNYMV